MRSLILILGVLVMAVTAQRRPPNYSQEYMPETSFDCRDKILGGYYADLETDCQMFHVCVKVPGVGVQDFRFLCPNDTSFDQENQICASWYEVNCDASILFYSDNFDLYRIGYSPSSAQLPSSSANPVALGPSTVRPAVRSRLQPRPQPRPQEDEDEYYLQRSDTGDQRLQQGKDLRSSSSNYFGRNKGKEDEYAADAYLKKTAKPYKPVAPSTAAPPTTYVTADAARKKVAVRKLRKRPQNVSYQPEDEATVAAPAASQGAFRGRNYDYTTQAASTANYNAYTPRYNTIQRNGNSSPQATTQAAASFSNYDGSYQQPSAQTNYNNNYNFAPRASSAKPVEYSTTTAAPTNYYQAVQRKTPEYTTTTVQTPAPNNYYSGNYQPSEYTSAKNYNNYDYNAYTSTAAPASYDQYNYQAAARNTKASTTTTAAPYDYQTTSEAYKYTYQRSVQAQFNAQPSYQQAEDESLKTAQSSNYGPSSFNTYQNNYDAKASNYNHTSGSSPKTSAISSAQKSSTTYATKPAANYDYQSTASPPRPFSAVYSPTAPASSRLPPTAARRASTAVPTSTTIAPASSTKNLKDVSYDYAYYDEANTEYDGQDPIRDHHFGKAQESFKVARAVKP